MTEAFGRGVSLNLKMSANNSLFVKLAVNNLISPTTKSCRQIRGPKEEQNAQYRFVG